MRNALFTRTVVTVAVVGVTLGALLSTRSGAAPQAAPTSSDALLSEIKALRADLNQRLDASIRAQLLVARLQLQEQRITTISRQLTDVQQQLQNNERARGPLEGQLKAFEGMIDTDGKKEENFLLTTLRSQLELMTKADDDLKRQQAYLSGLMAEEQSRWTAFNTRLEELERLLTSAAPPRDR